MKWLFLASVILIGAGWYFDRNSLLRKFEHTSDSLAVYRTVHGLNTEILFRIDSLSKSSQKHSETINNYIKNYTYEINNADSLLFDSLSILVRADIQGYEPRQYRSPQNP